MNAAMRTSHSRENLTKESMAWRHRNASTFVGFQARAQILTNTRPLIRQVSAP